MFKALLENIENDGGEELMGEDEEENEDEEEER